MITFFLQDNASCPTAGRQQLHTRKRSSNCGSFRIQYQWFRLYQCFKVAHPNTKISSSTFQQWGSPSASDPRAKNTGQRATKGTVLMSQSLSPWCDCHRLGSTLVSWRWQDINIGNPLWRRALLKPFWVRKPGYKTETCQCKLHETAPSMHSNLKAANAVTVNSVEDSVRDIVCSNENKVACTENATGAETEPLSVLHHAVQRSVVVELADSQGRVWPENCKRQRKCKYMADWHCCWPEGAIQWSPGKDVHPALVQHFTPARNMQKKAGQIEQWWTMAACRLCRKLANERDIQNPGSTLWWLAQSTYSTWHTGVAYTGAATPPISFGAYLTILIMDPKPYGAIWYPF